MLMPQPEVEIDTRRRYKNRRSTYLDKEARGILRDKVIAADSEKKTPLRPSPLLADVQKVRAFSQRMEVRSRY